MKRKKIYISEIPIGDGERVPFIAELGVNHLGSLDRAVEMVDKAIEGGSDFLKLQTYIAEDRYEKSNPKYKEFTKLLTDWQLSRKDETKLWEYAKSKKAKLFTSVYDAKSIDFAVSLGTIAFKVAAFELTNKNLIRKIIKTKLPIIISCGMTNIDEIKKTISILEELNSEYILLHTVSSYPLNEEDSYLNKINILKENFDCPIGHSDHTPGTNIPPLAAAAGAQIIEKHFTVNPKYRLSDNFFSVTSQQVKKIKFDLDHIYNVMYSPNFEKNDPEKYMRDFKKYSK